MGFDVECLATLYIDKPMRAHNLKHAIARANRVYPGKDCGVIVDYKGMLKSLREALAQYALGDEEEGGAEGLTVDLSRIDFAKLRDEFASKVRRKHAALQDIREVVEKKLAQMLARNPMRMNYYKRYREIIADYNREKDRVTVEATFAQLVALASSLDIEQRRAADEGLSDAELALFGLLFKDTISTAGRERLKQASKALLASLRDLLRPMHDWTQNTTTQAEVKVFILDNLWAALPGPPFTDQETEAVANRVYDFVWQQSASGHDLGAA
jgi:type I restriction enzyme R subunit